MCAALVGLSSDVLLNHHSCRTYKLARPLATEVILVVQAREGAGGYPGVQV
jgi:hypothetical protein